MFIVRKVIAPFSVPCIHRNFSRFTKKDPDPGISRRKKLLPQLENEEIPDFEDLESDFMGVHKLHAQHEKELAHLKEKEKFLIVREKYFKDKIPNFLTWHDKEQIRYLHNTDPEEWTIERLSEGFPALPDVIKKIIKSDWVKMKQHKISNHDASVQRNWNLFKRGQMSELHKDVVEHLNKFTNRALNLKPFVLPAQKSAEVQSKTTSSEFVDIIKSFERIKNRLPETEKQIAANPSDKLEKEYTYSAAPVGKRRSLTLAELQDKLTKRIEAGINVDEEERYIVNNVKTAENDKNGETRLVELTQKYETSTGVLQLQKTEKDYSHLNYPDKIRIPQSIFKKGTTYKLNDCYYDDDGEFLYRVPGME